MIVAMIQARMGSTRLPGKVLMDINGKPSLDRMIDRVRQATLVDRIVVLTSVEPADDEIESHLFGRNDVMVYRGDEADVLNRYVQAIRDLNIKDDDGIIRLTADCPLIDPRVLDGLIQYYKDNEYDYVSNILPATFPDGLDCEILSKSVFKRLDAKSTGNEREHVTLNIRNNRDDYSVGNYECHTDYSNYRWTLDMEKDLEYIRMIFGAFSDDGFFFEDVIKLIETGDIHAYTKKRN